MTKKLGFLCALSVWLMPQWVLADAPALIPFQGRLAAVDGLPLEGGVTIQFSLYTEDAGGVAIYTETQTVTAREGTFTAYVGVTTPLDLATFRDEGDLWLGITVEDDVELAPRYRLGSTPYSGFAQYCGEAAFLGGLSAADFARAVHTHDFSELTSVPPDVGVHYTDADAVAALTSHTSDSAAHHAAYTDADAVGALMSHTSNPSAHHAAYTDADAVGALSPHTSDPAAHHSAYTDGDAVAAIAATDAYVQNTGDTITGALEVTGPLTATGGIRSGTRVFQMRRMPFSRGAANTVSYTDPDGVAHSLAVPDQTMDVTGTHIAYRAASGTLYFNIEASPSYSCTLLHNEDDTPRQYQFATDAGNCCGTIWPDATTSTFMIQSPGGTNALPIAAFGGFEILCF